MQHKKTESENVEEPMPNATISVMDAGSANQENQTGRTDEDLKKILESAGAICHELNQPLQYILGALQLLLMDISADDAVYERLQTIMMRAEQMGEITRKLAEVTRSRNCT